MSIYVEIFIRAPIEAVWTHTQTPELHQRWDLRFSEIAYLPRSSDAAPQRFRYATRIGFGLEVSGEGEILGQRTLSDGNSSSSLKFWSTQRLSLIREGSGYWKYVPGHGGVRFLTSYDYHTRFGRAGAVFDRWIFRPLIGWATAWSFDRLRLWLERGVEPSLALRQTVVHCVARVALVCIFLYHGLLPKLVAPHRDEIAMLRDAGIGSDAITTTLRLLGTAEIAFAAALAIAWCRRWPLWICVASLALIDLLTLDGVPSAARCLRRPAEEGP